jgi:hypothetical protein
MKIEKFNESYRGDKVIKLYENSVIKDYFTDKEDSNKRLNEKYNNILTLINEYVNFNKDYFNKKYDIYSKITHFHFYIDEETKLPNFLINTSTVSPTRSFQIMKDYVNRDNHLLIYKDIEGLLKFIENPNMLRNVKKYNL